MSARIQEFFTTGDVARRLGVSRERVLQLILAGRLRPAARIPRGAWLFTPEDVQRLERERGERTQQRR